MKSVLATGSGVAFRKNGDAPVVSKFAQYKESK